jgi:hypothetical protein
MKPTLIILLMFAAWQDGRGQRTTGTPQFSRLSVTVSLDMQGFSVPFSKLRTYAENRGLSLGMVYRYNRSGSLSQQVKGGMFFNKFHGASYYVSSSVQFNPLHSRGFNAGISLGGGYMRSGFKAGGWRLENNEWKETANVRGYPFIPVAAHFSVRAYSGNQIHVYPTVSYQANALLGYSPGTFIMPQSILSTGLTIKF